MNLDTLDRPKLIEIQSVKSDPLTELSGQVLLNIFCSPIKVL